MKKNNNNKDNKNLVKIIIIIIIVLIIIPFIIYINYSEKNKKIENEFKKEGYNTTKEDAFYRKITTDNTLDDYYEKMKNNIDTEYQEYYYAKQSNDFIEVKMKYYNNVSTSLNIASNLEKNTITFSFELAYKEAHLLLEGSSKDDYNCNIINNNKVKSDIVERYCNMIIDEINSFNKVKEDLLKNDKIRDLSNKNE